MKALLVEDNPADARLIRELLKESPAGALELEQVSRLDTALERLRRETFDVVLLDLGLPDSEGMGTLSLVHKASGGAPVVVLTGLDDPRFALDAVRAGAQDYLIKGRFDSQSLARTIRYAVERKQAEASLQRERKRLHDVLETLPVMICLLTPDYHVAFANRSFRKRFGETNGRHCYEYCFGRTQPCEFCESYGVLQTGQPHHWEVTGPDGSVIDCHDFPFTDSDGSPLILEMNADITEIRKVQSLLQTANERLEQRVAERTADLKLVARKFVAMFDTTSDGVWIHNLQGKIVEVNDAYCRMAGYSREELIQMPVSRLEANETEEEIVRHIRKLLESGGHDSFESRHRRKDGSIFDVDITALHLEIDGGRIAVFVRDISARKKAEAELRESRKRYQTLIETVNDFIWEMDSQGRYTYCSPQMERLWGLKPQQMLGKTPFDVMPQEQRHGAEESFLEMLKSPRPFSGLESAAYDGHGNLIYVETSGVPFFDDGGNLLGFRGTSRDITERRRAEEALRQAEAAEREARQRLQALMEAVPVGISFSDDITCHRVTGNPAVLAQLEMRAQDNLSASAPDPAIPGRRVRYFQDGREISDAELPLQRAVAENRVIPPMEFEVALPSGRRWSCEGSGAPVRDAEGKVFAGLAVTIDTTARKLSEQAMVRAEKLAAAGRMAAAVAHEINNPLAAITNCIYLVQSDPSLSETSREYLRSAEQELVRVAELTRQTLGFYRQRSPAGSSFVGDIVNDVLRTYGHKLSGKNVVVVTDLATQVRQTKVAGELRQVLSNIVANSIDAMLDSGKLHIRARASCAGGGAHPRLMISVADTGGGIRPELRERVFEPFFTTKQEFGTGLGLWVTRELLRKNGGSIRLRSRPGQGTVFTIFLPFAAAATPKSLAAVAS